jgi:hypothetical protein
MKAKMILLASTIAFAVVGAAHAEQTSILCKTFDTKEFVDIVSKGEKTNSVLVQFNGGKFFDGFSVFDDPMFKVVVPFDAGSAVLIWDVRKQKGGIVLSDKDGPQVHEIACVFR